MKNNSFNFPLKSKPFDKIIYVSHIFQNEEKNVERTKEIMKQLIKAHPGNLFISPILSFGCLYETVSYMTGMDMCFWLLERCDEMWVIEDYKNSVGVQMEINYCIERGIPISYYEQISEA